MWRFNHVLFLRRPIDCIESTLWLRNSVPLSASPGPRPSSRPNLCEILHQSVCLLSLIDALFAVRTLACLQLPFSTSLITVRVAYAFRITLMACTRIVLKGYSGWQ